MTNRAHSTHTPDRQNGSGFLLPKPRRKPFRMSRERRQRIEDAVEGLLHFLDVIDGDPDEEDNGDREPSTSALTSGAHPLLVASGDLDECEPPEHDEFSLGWTLGINQAAQNWTGEPRWGGGGWDREAEHDGREPSLGSLDNISQERWGSSDTRDLEPNGDEEDGERASTDEPVFPAPVRLPRIVGFVENDEVTLIPEIRR
jgi:hypothetical protein